MEFGACGHFKARLLFHILFSASLMIVNIHRSLKTENHSQWSNSWNEDKDLLLYSSTSHLKGEREWKAHARSQCVVASSNLRFLSSTDPRYHSPLPTTGTCFLYFLQSGYWRCFCTSDSQIFGNHFLKIRNNAWDYSIYSTKMLA